MIPRLRRSSLYVPGDSEKMLKKAARVPSDMLLFNLEDGVAASKKNEARGNIAGALKAIDYGGRETVVRINGLDSEIGLRDLAAVIPFRPDGICLPKVEKAAEIQTADVAIRELEIGSGVPEGTVKLHAMIESAAGLLNSPQIAAASHRMSSFIFGSADYAKDLRCQPGEDRLELLFALQMIVTSARSTGMDAIDAPCFNFRNEDLLRREAEQARRMGFDGKSALHPDQLGILNQIFDVTAEEIEWAEKVLAELDEAESRGKALATLDGRLIEDPHRVAALRILSRRKPR